MFTSGSAHGEATGQLEGERLYHASLDSTEDKQLLESHRFDVVASVPGGKPGGMAARHSAQLSALSAVLQNSAKQIELRPAHPA